MKKFIKLPSRFDVSHYPQQTVFAVHLGVESIQDWCLGLCLLKEGLVEEVVCSPLQGKFKLNLRIAPRPEVQGKILGTCKPEAVSLQLTPQNVGYLLTFGLRYYRDGYAAVDHIDLEATLEGLANPDAYITLKFADFAPPVSAEEARKRLGD